MKKEIAVYSLFQSYHTLVARTEGELLFFGKDLIRSLIRSWRSSAKRRTDSIKRLQVRINALEDQDASSIRAIAKSFEDPDFPITSLPVGRDPEPTDNASLLRKSGATTFNVCGWCEYASCGRGRYQYHIATSCLFTTEETKHLSGVTGDHRFNTVCFLKQADTQTFQLLLKGLRRELEEAISAKKEIDTKISYLLKLKQKAEETACLTNHRDHNMFSVGDQVIIYIGEWPWENSEKLVDKTFVSARVIDGYLHHKGYVYVCFDEKVHTGEYLNGKGGGYGMSRPEVMLPREFEYLLAHPDFADLYASGHDLLKGFDKSSFLRHLKDFAKSKK